MHCSILSLCFLQLGISVVLGVFNDCQTKDESCSACISYKPGCGWCEDPIYKRPETKSYYKRCDTLQNHKDQKCQNITNPNSKHKTTKDAKLEGETRVSPQAIKVKLRPGQPTSFPIRVKTPVNFPIDLYYLMDFSESMKDDLQQIKGLGNLLGKELKEITTNFRLGFGGFVDKPVGPYTIFHPDEIAAQEASGFQHTFSYTNYLPLNENASAFSDAISKVKISYNNDFPEGILDALAQVIMCPSDIKWRSKNKARRIVVMTTDATFHYSGDGLLGGFTKPYDGKCHMVNDKYNAWNKFDYPSLSQIRSMLIANDIVPIFATTGYEELYKKVSRYIENGAQAENLLNDSSNVAPLVREAYEKIARIVNIKADLPKNIKVKYSADCSKKKDIASGLQCENIDIGEEVTFKVELVAESCNADQKIDFTIDTSFDNVNVSLELICECDCGKPLVNSSVCNGVGDLVCGKCVCDPEKYGGRFCGCTAEEARNQTLCKTPGTAVICSGKGKCNCAECQCNIETRPNGIIEYFYGDQCQCSNATCATYNGLICGGADRGSCDCGKCICNPAWTGRICEKACEVSEDRCYDPNDATQTKCYGKGECKCNQCQCFKGAVGKYCDECVDNTCPDECRDFKECVKCKVFETGDLSTEECTRECNKWNITSHIVVDKIEDEKSCLERDEDDCAFIFNYRINNVTELVELTVQRERICPAEPDILAIILGVIAGIVGIGLALLLIWKLLATIQDRREFAKFEKDLQNPKWDSGENPIYKKATSTFQNPMYGEKPAESEQQEAPLIE